MCPRLIFYTGILDVTYKYSFLYLVHVGPAHKVYKDGHLVT